MKKYLLNPLSITLFVVMAGCAHKAPTQEYVVPAKEVIEVSPKVQAASNQTNFQLIYGNDSALEHAFHQYLKTGSAPNILTDGFEKFAYNSGQQPIIRTSPFQETVISLEPGEKFTNVTTGDPNRWTYSAALSGMGSHQQQHILVKPSAADLSTNMVITTDRRIYNLRLVSSTDTLPTRTVSFWYPGEMVATLNAVSQQENTSVAEVPDVSLNNLNFNYGLASNTRRLPSWAPTRIFDDGSHTYIQFPEDMANRDMPALFVLNGNAKELVNYRSKAPYLIVDKIFKQAVLVIGVGRSQTSVMMTNKRYAV